MAPTASNSSTSSSALAPESTLLYKFLQSQRELESYRFAYHSPPSLTVLPAETRPQYRTGEKPVTIDGYNLSIAAVTAAARYSASVNLDHSPRVKSLVAKSRAVIAEKVESGASVYGLSTGFGGSGTFLQEYLSVSTWLRPIVI